MRVVKAAIQILGEVFTVEPPGRHLDIITAYAENIGGTRRRYPMRSAVEGFVTSDGQFVTREEAAKIAFESKQIRVGKVRLRSEDLW